MHPPGSRRRSARAPARSHRMIRRERSRPALEGHALQVRREPSPRQRVAQHGATEGELRFGACKRTACAGRDDRECDTVADGEVAAAQHGRRKAPARAAHLDGRGVRLVTLLVDIGVLQPRERGQRVGLRQCRHAPCPDRRSDQLERPGACEPLRVKQPVERQQCEALGPAGGSGDAGDVRRRNTVLLQVGDRGGTAAQHERRRRGHSPVNRAEAARHGRITPPSGRLPTSSVPPCASTISRHSVSPRPVPLALVE